MLSRGICKGEPSTTLAEENDVSWRSAQELRRALQRNCYQMLPQSPLLDRDTETDELFRNAGKKGEKHADPTDPPRGRANDRRGHGTYANHRPPVIGTVGRETGQVRLRVAKRTDKRTLHKHVHMFTRRKAHSNTDEWFSYSGLARPHSTICRGKREWARDDDEDGINEVHVNTIEGLWTTTRNFLRLFRGVHKKNLQNYLAVCEFNINQKKVSPAFIAQ